MITINDSFHHWFEKKRVGDHKNKNIVSSPTTDLTQTKQCENNYK